MNISSLKNQEHITHPFENRLETIVGFYLPAFLLSLLWLWPFAHGPLSAVWPDLFAYLIVICLSTLLLTTPQYAAYAMAVGCICAALVSSLLGLTQYFGLNEPLWPVLVRAELGQAYANLRQTNHLATLLSIGLWSTLWFTTQYRFSKYAFAAIGLVLASGMAATASRTGALQFLFLTLLALHWLNHRKFKIYGLVSFVGLSYLVLAFLLPWLLAYFYTTGFESRALFSRLWTNQGCSSRAVLWSNVVDLIALKPITGWGVGELPYAHYISLYEGQKFCDKLGNAHNIILHAAFVFGTPLVLCLVGALTAAVCVFRPWRESESGAQLAWGILGLLLIHSMLEYPLWFGNFQVLTLLCIFILFFKNSSQQKNLKIFILNRKIPIRIMFFIALSSITYIGWDYFRISQLYIPAGDRLQMFRYDTLEKVRKTALFSSEVLFAQVNNAEPNAQNAKVMLSAAQIVVRDYPEPRIVSKLIEAAVLTGNQDLAQYHKLRFKNTWPKDYIDWSGEIPAPR